MPRAIHENMAYFNLTRIHSMAKSIPQRLICCAAILALTAPHIAFAADPLQALPQNAQAAMWTAMLLTRHYLKNMPLDDTMSEQIFDRYLKALDPNRELLTQSDVDFYASAKTKLDDAIKNENLSLPFAMFNLVSERAAQRYAVTKKLLAGVPDFTLHESLSLQRNRAPWPGSENELHEQWRKSVKHDWLQLRLVGTSDADIGVALQRRNDASLARMMKVNQGDALQLFLNAYTSAIDPHTHFRAPSVAAAADDVQPMALPVATSSIISVVRNGAPQRVGVIKLRAFFDTQAVARLLQELRNDKVDKLIVDLRDNEGGPLKEVRAFSGLFIGNAPLAQEVDAKGIVTIGHGQVTSDSPVWDGRLAVLVNRRSAAGSEIFSAAIQDHGLGLILGEPTFGMGLVYTVIDLDRKTPDRPQYGTLKMPVTQVIRITGEGIQLRGVTPDIKFQVSIDASAVGESLLDNALPGSRAGALAFTPRGNFSAIVPMLQARHAAREGTDAGLQRIAVLARQFDAANQRSNVTLNEAERRKNSGPVLGPLDLDAAVLKEAAAILIDEADILRANPRPRAPPAL